MKNRTITKNSNSIHPENNRTETAHTERNGVKPEERARRAGEGRAAETLGPAKGMLETPESAPSEMEPY